MKCSCGKKFFAPALFAAAIITATAFALFACGGGDSSSGDSYISGNFGTGESGIGGGDNTGNEGENQGGENKNENESGGNDEPSGNEPTITKTLTELFKYYMTDDVYDKLSGKIGTAKNINLSAQTIEDAGTIFPVLQNIAKEARTEEYFNSNKPSEITATENDLNKALIALKEGYISIQQSKLSILKTLNLEGTYNLSEIEIDNSSNKGDFSSATFTGSNITIDKINTARGTSLPILDISVKAITNNNKKNAENIYKIYKEYSKDNNLSKVKLSGNLSQTVAFDGKEISGKSDYTLFKNRLLTS